MLPTSRVSAGRPARMHKRLGHYGEFCSRGLRKLAEREGIRVAMDAGIGISIRGPPYRRRLLHAAAGPDAAFPA